MTGVQTCALPIFFRAHRAYLMLEIVALEIDKIDIRFGKVVLSFALFPKFIYRIELAVELTNFRHAELHIQRQRTTKNVCHVRNDNINGIVLCRAVLGDHRHRTYYVRP